MTKWKIFFPCFACLPILDGSRNITYFGQTDKPNAGQPVTISCEGVGNPLPAANEIFLYGPDSVEVPYNRSEVSTNLNAYKRTNVFVLDGAYATAESVFICYLVMDGTYVNKEITVDVYGKFI